MVEPWNSHLKARFVQRLRGIQSLELNFDLQIMEYLSDQDLKWHKERLFEIWQKLPALPLKHANVHIVGGHDRKYEASVEDLAWAARLANSLRNPAKADNKAPRRA